jgi:hypothetical protein
MDFPYLSTQTCTFQTLAGGLQKLNRYVNELNRAAPASKKFRIVSHTYADVSNDSVLRNVPFEVTAGDPKLNWAILLKAIRLELKDTRPIVDRKPFLLCC